jgi:hypothetical protein
MTLTPIIDSSSADVSNMSSTDADRSLTSATTSDSDAGATAGLRRSARDIKNICCVGAGYVGM